MNIEEKISRLINSCNKQHKKLITMEKSYVSLRFFGEPTNLMINPIKQLQKTLAIDAKNLARLMFDQTPDFHMSSSKLEEVVVIRYSGQLRFD